LSLQDLFNETFETVAFELPENGLCNFVPGGLLQIDRWRQVVTTSSAATTASAAASAAPGACLRDYSILGTVGLDGKDCRDCPSAGESPVRPSLSQC
jgi:hypothetical protein